MTRRTAGFWMTIAVTLAAGSVIGCGSPPDQRAGATHFTGAASDPAVNRIILAATDAELAEDEIELAVRVEAIDRLYGGGFVLDYPASELTLASVATGDLIGAGHLVTTLGTAEELAGQLTVGFVRDRGDDASAVSGELAVLRFRASGGANAAVGFVVPVYSQESRQRSLIAMDGIEIAGVRWFGGTVTRDQL